MSTLLVGGMRGGYQSAEQIVKGVDLQIDGGELAVIIGPNGAGKSTFLKLAAGLLPFREGAVSIDAVPLRAGDAQGACAHGLGFVPQERNVFGTMSVRENLELGGFLQRTHLKSRVEEQLERFPLLKPRLKQKAGMLSGGQRQVLAMAIALMTQPTVLLLDEPTAGLSPLAAKEILDVVRELSRAGLAVLMVEQNALLALEFGTRGIVFVAGKKVRDQPANVLKDDSEIRRLFLGQQTTPHF